MNSTAKSVMRQAVLQNNYKESPAGSNRNKFGAEFGMNGVSWCAEYLWWCGYHAKGDNPIAKSASAAYIQDETVRKGGTWIMYKTGNTTAKKIGFGKARFGDIVSFDFGKNNYFRYHTAFVIGKAGNYYITIEGNTSAEGKTGSQSNGGQVAIRTRHYTQVCSIVRPLYGNQKAYTPSSAYKGKRPKLPKRGYFKPGDRGTQVKRLQKALNWSADADLKVDGDFGNETLFGAIWFQVCNGLVPDGEFGEKSLKKLTALINAKKPKKKDPEQVKKTPGDKIAETAVACAWAYGTPRKIYTYPTGSATQAFKRSFDKVFPDHKKWKDPQTRKGASCDVFASVCIRASGVDKNVPAGRVDQMRHYKSHPKIWNNTGISKVKDMRNGDVIIYTEKRGGGHVCIVAVINGKKYFLEAGYHSKRYGVVARRARNYSPGAYKYFHIYRARG